MHAGDFPNTAAAHAVMTVLRFRPRKTTPSFRTRASAIRKPWGLVRLATKVHPNPMDAGFRPKEVPGEGAQAPA